MWGQGLDHWQGWTGWSLKWVGLGRGMMEAGPDWAGVRARVLGDPGALTSSVQLSGDEGRGSWHCSVGPSIFCRFPNWRGVSLASEEKTFMGH